ncbi:FecCD family ABC transporter permease [Paenibacillus sinopodophylli]|uniref:FecCD family ABC transporter permease n=1 Tax=Paenibacillus sinopodophylli TaxID=1837342 RepID=UPI00110D195C|nr:iron ABC transporter permease [Paenibacillus sinopodophylli]
MLGIRRPLPVGSKPSASYFAMLMLAGLVLLLLAAAASISFGAARMDLTTAWTALFSFDSKLMEHQIVRFLRAPRTIADIMVGASLAAAGAIMQGSTRNPLADSGLMGINAGAALAMAIALAFFPGSPYTTLLLICFIGAGAGAGFTYLTASFSRKGMTPQRLVLAGLSITMLFGAIGTFISLIFKIGQALSYWTSGSVAGATWHELALVAPWFIAGLALALGLAPSITILNLGDEIARSVGQRVLLVKLLSVLAVLILAGLSVVLVGPIGFVGLIIPHMMRFMVGVDYRHIIPSAALYGAVFMLAADLVGRLINRPNEIALGIIFAIVGVPFFLLISRKERRAFN